MQAQRPFSLAIDLTRGKLSEKLPELMAEVPLWDDFSVSRVRQVTDPSLPTSGHLLSHDVTDIRNRLDMLDDPEHILVLDDTSFSGTTSLLIERLINEAMPDKQLAFTHGFLLLNDGRLGEAPGATQRITDAGSRAVGGMNMHTPTQDGWHFFDIVKQRSIREHLLAVLALAKLATRDDFEAQATSFLADETRLATIFPNMLSADELRDKEKIGRFVIARGIEGGFHSPNPQLLPSIIRQGHLQPPELWRLGEEETLEQIIRLNTLIERSTHV